MADFSYIAQAYSQGQSSKTLLSFTANASDIFRWGGVPSKNERFHGGFQRALSARYEKIIKYFDKGQISPGAIVVAFRPHALKVTPLGHPASWPTADSVSTAPKFVHLEFESDESEIEPLDKLISKVRALLEMRPGFNPGVDDGQDSDQVAEESDDSTPDSDPNDSASDGDDDLDVGHSKLNAFYKFLGDPKMVREWIDGEDTRISSLKQAKSLTKAQKEYVALTAEEKLRATLVSLLRPAMIVDGQHRVSGANESEHEPINFTVCAIQDADWVEQVFQFVVLNKMARPISKDFLTELLNTSLTNQEVDDIDKRLETIGIKNADRRIHKYINHDPRSPFAGLVAEAGEVIGIEKTGKLSQQGMLQLAKRWRAISGPRGTSEISCFIKALGASNITEARGLWQNYETWMPFFFSFWEQIRKKYEPQKIWVKAEKHHLLYIVTLQAMQDLFIESKANGKVKFLSLDDFRSQVDDFFEEVPAIFFLDWTQTGLQSGDGWTMIKKAIGMLQGGSTPIKVREISDLWK